MPAPDKKLKERRKSQLKDVMSPEISDKTFLVPDGWIEQISADGRAKPRSEKTEPISSRASNLGPFVGVVAQKVRSAIESEDDPEDCAGADGARAVSRPRMTVKDGLEGLDSRHSCVPHPVRFRSYIPFWISARSSDVLTCLQLGRGGKLSRKPSGRNRILSEWSSQYEDDIETEHPGLEASTPGAWIPGAEPGIDKIWLDPPPRQFAELRERNRKRTLKHIGYFPSYPYRKCASPSHMPAPNTLRR